MSIHYWYDCVTTTDIIAQWLPDGSRVCFITRWLRLLCDWRTACLKADPGGIGEEEPRRQLQWRLKSSCDSLPSLFCGHEIYVQMCVASIYELLTCVWPQCQHPLPCVCVEACNSLLLVLLKVQGCHILFSASLPFKPLLFTPCWPASDTGTIMYSLLTCIAYNDATQTNAQSHIFHA